MGISLDRYDDRDIATKRKRHSPSHDPSQPVTQLLQPMPLPKENGAAENPFSQTLTAHQPQIRRRQGGKSQPRRQKPHGDSFDFSIRNLPSDLNRDRTDRSLQLRVCEKIAFKGGRRRSRGAAIRTATAKRGSFFGIRAQIHRGAHLLNLVELFLQPIHVGVFVLHDRLQ